ncbi:hypothetical protein [Ferrovibrio sp.]|uniref:hypothetical protein n=1 Tax=Ferrovibrio sp. TaxID=1917215 RepID=UPI003D11F6E4
MGEGAKSGLKTALGQAEALHEPEPAPMQLPLYPADALGALPAGADRTAVLREPGRRGRPPGATNKSTGAMREFILSRYRHPALVLAETYSRDTGDLAAELGCTRYEAFKLQREAAADLLPYVQGKMPVEVQVTSNVPVLMLADPSSWLGQAEGDALPDLGAMVPIQQNQGVIEGQAVELNAGQLNADQSGPENGDKA